MATLVSQKSIDVKRTEVNEVTTAHSSTFEPAPVGPQKNLKTPNKRIRTYSHRKNIPHTRTDRRHTIPGKCAKKPGLWSRLSTAVTPHIFFAMLAKTHPPKKSEPYLRMYVGNQIGET